MNLYADANFLYLWRSKNKIMVDLQIEQNERIIRRTKEAWSFDGDEERELKSLFLTNKHLISIYEKSIALFFDKIVVDKKPLASISVIDGVLQVKNIMDENFGESLQILFDNGAEELYFFGDAPKSEYQQWESAIKKAVIENNSTITKNDEIPESLLSSEENKHVVSTTIVEEKVNEKRDMTIYCVSCGAKNNIEARFCQSCGTLLGTINKPDQTEKPKKEEQYQQSTYSERKQEFIGKILKCPSCGAQLPSFTAICPDCGHEINTQNVSSSLKEFIDSINEYDKAIANDSELLQTGWRAWSKNKKILWVVLNIFTSFIPLVIYLTFPLIKPFLLPKSVPKLSADEKRKASLIENYTFPNEREATIEALMFTKSKMAFLASEKFNKKTLYWLNLWNTKAEQLNQRASIILQGDKLVESTYEEITASKDKVNKSVKIRAIIGASIIVLFLAFVLINGSILSGVKNIFSSFGGTSNTTDSNDFEWLGAGLSTKIPKIDAKEGRIYTNSDTELWISLDGVSYNEFEKYITYCKGMGYTLDAVKDTYTYTAYNDEGYFIEVSGYGDALSVELKAPQTGIIDYKWPDSNLAKQIPKTEAESGSTSVDDDEKCEIFLYGVSDEDFDAYIEICENEGYTVDCDKSNQMFSGFNNEGYKISVSLNDMKRMTITLDAPMIMTEINWPTVGVAKVLPKPKSKIGNITSNYDFSFTVYIGNTTIDEYNDYVDKCIKKGFDKKTYRSDMYFSAENKKGDSLIVEYSGFDTICISIHNYSRF